MRFPFASGTLTAYTPSLQPGSTMRVEGGFPFVTSFNFLVKLYLYGMVWHGVSSLQHIWETPSDLSTGPLALIKPRSDPRHPQ